MLRRYKGLTSNGALGNVRWASSIVVTKPFVVTPNKRYNSTVATTEQTSREPTEKKGILFVDSIFPVQLGIWE
jgi:hypothetical protein